MEILQPLIFYPVFAMIVLTVIIWLTLYRRRVGEMRRKRIDPQSISTSRTAMESLSDVSAADNLRNLLEIPVLFYVVCISLYVTDLVTGSQLTLAWIYVTLRVIHSFIHITYNRVIHRFWVYVASCLVLWCMWLLFAYTLMHG